MSTTFPVSLPAALARRLRGSAWQADTLGESAAKVYRFSRSTGAVYLKICAVEPFDGLRSEADALAWLGQRLPAPEVVHYERADGTDYLLMREVPGWPTSDKRWTENPDRLARCLGESLRALHALDVATCPIDQRLATKLADVARNVARGLVDEQDFGEDIRGTPPAQLVERLLAERPTSEDVVVTHGDYCLPNVLVQDWQLSGFIDVGRLGQADRYTDVAICTDSLAYNLNTDRHTATFLSAYGLDRADAEKTQYYRLLNELL